MTAVNVIGHGPDAFALQLLQRAAKARSGETIAIRQRDVQPHRGRRVDSLAERLWPITPGRRFWVSGDTVLRRRMIVFNEPKTVLANGSGTGVGDGRGR